MKRVKFRNYNFVNFFLGMTTHIGLGHSAVITSVHFSADGKYIISGNAAGTIFVYDCPINEKEKSEKEAVKDSAELNTEEKNKGTEENIKGKFIIIIII